MDDVKAKVSTNGGLINNIETIKALLGFKDKQTPDLFDSVASTQEKVVKDLEDRIPARKTLNDAYGNKITGSGTFTFHIQPKISLR